MTLPQERRQVDDGARLDAAQLDDLRSEGVDARLEGSDTIAQFGPRLAKCLAEPGDNRLPLGIKVASPPILPLSRPQLSEVDRARLRMASRRRWRRPLSAPTLEGALGLRCASLEALNIGPSFRENSVALGFIHAIHHVVPTTTATRPGARIAQAASSVHFNTTRSCWNADEVGAATTAGVPGVPICAGLCPRSEL
jgi:hypothetical protein